MSISFSQPIFAVAAILVVPAFVYTVIKSKTVLRLLSNYAGKNSKEIASFKARIVVRTITWSGAWVCACIALSGPSWGTELVPVQKSGQAVSFVFDISYSMTATDIQNDVGKTRLGASKDFAQSLLSSLPGVATSAVLAKGDGVLAVPLTEDYYALSNLITSLSPTMLSHPGSSLSKGVLKAIESFPPQSARSSFIVVFTDGDDTDGALVESVEKALSFGIHVMFVGFGSQAEVEVIAGDGVTRVKTALRADKLMNIAQNDNVDFIFAQDSSAIDDIVKIIRPTIFFTESATTTAYEVEPIKRHSFFITLALLLFVVGVCLYSFVPTKLFSFMRSKKYTNLLLLVVLCTGLFTGCTEWTTNAKDVLEGSYYWSQQNYQESVASFLEVTTRSQESGNTELLQYGLYGLSANYLMQGEMEASLAKINDMNPTVPPSLDFARWYNKGIVFHRNGEYAAAAFCFKKALLVDSTNIHAKINLELCLDNGVVQNQQGIQERIPTAEQSAPPGASDAVFSLIRENEENQWKNQETEPDTSGIVDY